MAGTELDLLDGYRQLLTIREFESHAARLRTQGVIVCSLHLADGHEAVAVGARAALNPTDTVNATYRGHHWAIASGTLLEPLFAEFMGRATGVNGGRGGAGFFADGDHAFLGESGIVGATAPIATGAALGFRHDGSGRVAVAAFGDGALNQGAVHEAMNFAGVYDLPVIFVCENNGYAEFTPTEAMFAALPLERRAEVYGFPGIAVDGTDLAAVHAAVGTAAQRARAGQGPSLLVCATRRLGGHTTHDPEVYRPAGEKAAWSAEGDPLARLHTLLTESGAAGAEQLESLATEVRDHVRAAAQAAREAPTSDPATLEQHLYG